MPKLPDGMVRRKGRPGWYHRRQQNGRRRWFALGTDYQVACATLKRLKAGITEPVGAQELPDATVAEAVEKWLAGSVVIQRSPKNQAMTRRRAELHMLPLLGDVVLARLTSERVREYRLQLERKTLAAQTVKHLLSDLRCFLHWADETGYIERSPFPRRVMPKIQEQPPDRVTDAQATALRELPGVHGFVCRLALGTGLRWGELCRAQASDVRQGYIEVHHTKSGKLRRVPLPPELREELRTRLGRLVPFAEGSPGSFSKAVRTAMEGVAAAAKVSELATPGFHVHQMRHTFACQWIERGGSLASLQQILGHASIVTTQRYARLSDEAVMREAERLAEARG